MTRIESTTNIRVRAIIVFLFVQSLFALDNTFETACSKILTLFRYHAMFEAVALLSTFVLIFAYTLFAQFIAFVAILVDGAVLFLIVKLLTNCTNIYQTNTCYSTIAVDIIIAVIVSIIAIIDISQFFSIDVQRRFLTKEVSPKLEHEQIQKRARLLHLWSMPFQIGVIISDIGLSYEDAVFSLIFLSLALTPLLVYTATLKDQYEVQIFSFILMILIAVADMINVLHKRSDYAQWCIITLLLFDLCLLGLRLVIATYHSNPKDKSD